MVPIKGAKRDSLHLIEEDLAMQFLPSGKILRFRLALAAKPHDVFFLCRIPTRNLDNSWNRDNVAACEQAKKLWVQATSRGEEGSMGTLSKSHATPMPSRSRNGRGSRSLSSSTEPLLAA
jgi:hypothetical protein